MRTLSALTIAILLSVSMQAQTTTASASWNQPEAPTVASAFVTTMKVDAAAPIPLTTTCVAATVPATGSSCSATFPLAAPTGPHSYTLQVCAGTFCSSTSVNGAAPGTNGFKISVTVVITTP